MRPDWVSKPGPLALESDVLPTALRSSAVPFVKLMQNMEVGKSLHGPSMFAVKAKIYGVLYNQASSIAFDETSSYWSALKSS